MATAKQLPSGKWFIQIKVNGRRTSNTFASKREAERWATQQTVEMRAIKSNTVSHLKTFGDAINKFMEEVTPERTNGTREKTRLKYLLNTPKFPGHVLLSDLSFEDFHDWKKERLKEVKASSLTRDMTVLTTVLRFAKMEWRWVDANVMLEVKRPPQPPHRERVITWSEQRKMLRALGYKPRNLMPRSVTQIIGIIFMFALRTGMRSGEIVGLTWERVHKSWVHLDQTKTDKKRDVPTPPKAKKLIECMRGVDEDKVFPVSSTTRDALFRRARDKLGLEGFTFHDGRHTAATRVGKVVGQPGKLTFPEFCKVFGWSDPKFALVYVNPTAADLALKM